MTDELLLVKRSRQAYSSDFKVRMVAQCQRPGVSVAGLALANGLNTNMLRRWVREHEVRGGAVIPTTAALPESTFVPVPMEASESRTCQLQLQGKSMSASLTVPLDALDQCARLLQLLLR